MPRLFRRPDPGQSDVEMREVPKSPPFYLRKRFLIPLSVILALLLGAVSGMVVSHYRVPAQRSVWQVFDRSWAEDVAIVREGVLTQTLPDSTVTRQLSSLDGTVECLQTADGGVYLLRRNNCSKIAERVFYMALSQNGKVLACINENLWLTVYNTASMEGSRIAKNVYGASISPEGDALAYYTMDNQGKTTAHLYTDGESRKLASNRIPFALSKGGEHIYCFSDQTSSLYALGQQGQSTKLTADLDRESPLLLNADHSQLIFSADGKVYISQSGSDKQLIGSGTLAPVPAAGGKLQSRYESGFSLITLARRSLAGHYYMNADTLCRLERNWELSTLAENVHQALCTSDGKQIFFLQDGETLRCGPDLAGDYPQIVSGVAAYGISPNGKDLWFTDLSGALWHRGKQGIPRLASEKAGQPMVTGDGACLYEQDGTLYGVEPGGAPERLFPAYSHVVITPAITYVLTTDAIYAGQQGTRFVPLGK